MKHIALHRGLHALHFGATAGLSYVMVAGVLLSVLQPLRPHALGATGVSSFSSSSLWNQAIPRYTDLDSANEAIGAELSSLGAYSAQLGTSTGIPMYAAELTTPGVAVSYRDCDGMSLGGVIDAAWGSVPIPFYAQPSSNGLLGVYRSATRTLWEFSGVEYSNGQWSACHGGIINDVSASNGVFPAPYGALGSGLSYLASQVTAAEIRNKQIGHAMGIYLPQVGSGSVAPARAIGGAGVIRPGQRLQLDPTIDVTSLGLNSTALLIAQNAQKYGFIVIGTAGSVSVAAENPLGYTTHGAASPYTGLSTSLAGFPWSGLRALPPTFNQSLHVPYITTFSAPESVAANHSATLKWRANNVDECAIPDVISHAPSSGEATSRVLASVTQFTLSCSGPDGSVSMSARVAVAASGATNDQNPSISQTLITPDLVGDAGILPDIADVDGPAVYKVGFYERDAFLFATTTAPFVLDTTHLSDGPHTLKAHIFYEDDTDEYRLVSMFIKNNANSFATAPLVSGILPGDVVPRGMLAAVAAGSVVCMLMAAYIGWKWSHPDRLRSRRILRPTPYY